MIRILFIFLTLSTLLLRSALATPLHWHAQKEDIELMIIGSVHVGDQSMYPLPTAVTDFLTQSKGLIIEADIRHTEGVIYPSSSITSHQVLNNDQRKQLTSIASDLSLPAQTLLNAPPWSSALTVQLMMFERMGYQATDGIDRHLISQALRQETPLLELESLQSQIDILASDEISKELLHTTIMEYEYGEQGIKCLINAWKAGDDPLLEKLSASESSSEAFTQRLLTSRNYNWVKKLSTASFYPSNGKYTLVVGTLHLVGEENVIELLKSEGFKVTSLGQSKKAVCSLEI